MQNLLFQIVIQMKSSSISFPPSLRLFQSKYAGLLLECRCNLKNRKLWFDIQQNCDPAKKYSAEVWKVDVGKHIWLKLELGHERWREWRDDMFWMDLASVAFRIPDLMEGNDFAVGSKPDRPGRARARHGARAPADSVVGWWRHASLLRHHLKPLLQLHS